MASTRNKNKSLSMKNYLVACLLILGIVLVVLYFYKWHQVKEEEKYLNSYLVNTGTVNLEMSDIKEINTVLSETPSYYFVYISYTKEEDVYNLEKELKPLISDSLEMMTKMREVEGDKLKEDILSKISIIEQLVLKVEEFADTIPKAFKLKLEERVKELLGNIDIDENRIAMEVCMLADKATVDEEIIRLRSHISQVRETLNLKEPVGRKLDFIVQEMNRETNTIGSKSSDIQMTNIVIDIKNILEKIREQVQNIE